MSKKNKNKATLAAKVANKPKATEKETTVAVDTTREKEVESIVKEAEQEVENTSKVTAPKKEETKTVEKNKPTEKNKKTTPKKEKEIPTIEAEEVTEPEEQKPVQQSSSTINSYKSAVMKNLANGDRIDANSSIKLMSMMKERWMDNPETNSQLKEIMSQQFDIMSLYSIIHWNIQTSTELGEAGIEVNKEMFDKIAEGLALYFGITVKGIANKMDSKQLQIDFDTPAKVKEEVENVEKIRKENISSELPVYQEGKKDEEVIKDLQIILAAKNGMGPNLENAITYARKAFKMEKDEPAKIICTILGKLPQENLLLNGYGRMVYGSLTVNSNPFMCHSLVHKFLPKFNDKEIANVCRLFFSLGAQLNLDSINKKTDPKTEATTYLAPWNDLIKVFTDKTINEIIETLKNKTKVVKLPSVKGLTIDEPLDCNKIITTIKQSYGTELNAKQIKQKLSQILNEYQQPFSPLDTYVEKGYKEEKK